MQPDETVLAAESVSDEPLVIPGDVVPSPLDTHSGIAALTEDNAAALFSSPEVQAAAASVQALLVDHRMHGAEQTESQRLAAKHWLEAAALLQSEGGRVHKVKGNLHAANALLHAHRAEACVAQAEMAWAQLALAHGCFLPSPYRLEVMMAERPDDGYVYCWDASENEMAWHKQDDCGQAALRHDHPENLLRRWEANSAQLVEIKGRKGLP